MFSEVTDLRIEIDWKTDVAGQDVLHPASIARLVRRQVDVSLELPRPVYEWSVELNWPAGGAITFRATSFTLQVRADAVETDARQHLSTAQRRQL